MADKGNIGNKRNTEEGPIKNGQDLIHDPSDGWTLRNSGQAHAGDSHGLGHNNNLRESGIPDQPVKDGTFVSDHESLLLKKRGQEEETFEADDLFKDIDQGGNLGALIKKTGLGSLLLVLGGLSLLVLFTEALDLAARLSALPQWAQIAGYAVMAVLTAVIVLAMARLLFLYVRLDKSPQTQFSALKELSLRSQARQQAHMKLAAGKKSLERFLKNYSIEKPKEKQELIDLGFESGEIDLLTANRDRLLKTASKESIEGWLDQLDKQFVKILDTAARRRIRRYALRVGLKTAAAPTGFVDTSIVLINAFQMLKDLCSIYRLRVGAVQTSALLFRIFVNVYAASRMEEWMDGAAKEILGAAAESGDTFMAAINSVARGIASRAAEGSANAFLLARLGAAAIHYLRPLS